MLGAAELRNLMAGASELKCLFRLAVSCIIKA
jgi:hypothetical protein